MQRENLLELIEGDLGVLLEDLVELLRLFVIGHEADHFEDGVEAVAVQLLLVSVATFELENFTEVLVLHIVHAGATGGLHF